jgi:hypothetical protein
VQFQETMMSWQCFDFTHPEQSDIKRFSHNADHVGAQKKSRVPILTLFAWRPRYGAVCSQARTNKEREKSHDKEKQ